MWIKKLPNVFQESMNSHANFLWKNDNAYVMDNHLSAGWCWLKECGSKQINLLHIDGHNDLCGNQVSVKEEISKTGLDFTNLSYEQYESLKQKMNLGNDVPLFRWDNYILNLTAINDNIFEKVRFATQEPFPRCKEFDIEFIEPFDIIDNLDYWLHNDELCSVLNLDLDYFFTVHALKRIRWLTDEFAKELALSINNVRDMLDCITICLSPECCNGWDNSLNVLSIFNDYLDLGLDIKELNGRVPR